MSPSLQAATKEGPKLVSDPGSDRMRVRAAAASSRAELQTDKDNIKNPLYWFNWDSTGSNTGSFVLTRNYNDVEYEIEELSTKYLFTGYSCVYFEETNIVE